MSVLIKGMEMPTNCFLCPLSVLNENRLFCEVTKNEVLRAKIDAECPLVPVPPHGDLIDSGAVNLSDGPYEYQDWVEWAWEQYLNAPVFLPADLPKEEE